MNKKQIDIDWRKCAEALNLKLNLIGARLKELNRETTSFEIAYTTAQLVDEFNLDTDQKFIRPDVADMQKKLDSAKSLLISARFATPSSRDNFLSDARDILAALSFDFSILAAFSLEAK